jgi:hypothetical protein
MHATRAAKGRQTPVSGPPVVVALRRGAVSCTANMPALAPLLLALSLPYAGPDPGAHAELEQKVKTLFEDQCTSCHDSSIQPADDEGVDLESDLRRLVNQKSNVAGEPMLVPGNPDASYLFKKMTGKGGIKGDTMPLGDDVLPEDQLAIVRDWIAAMPTDYGAVATDAGDGGAGDGGAGDEGGGDGGDGGDGGTEPKKKGRQAFYGTTQIVLPTTTTLGKRTLQYRIDHRFGRIGTERGAFGLDAGVSMAMGLQYGIFDGWDVQIRRANSRKTWEFGTKYVPVRQEDGKPVSFGGYFDFTLLRDFDVKNRYVGDFQLMLSRLWFQDRWATMLTFGYHMRTNHNPRVTVDFEDGAGPVPVKDIRDTLTLGLASTVYLGKRRRWGLDMEYVLPIPAGGTPDVFYFRGGDADPQGSKIGAWSIGGSLKTAKHFFQVFFTNNREIVSNLYAPGGQSGNPFKTPGQDSKNPFHDFNFFLGFNLGRRFSL